MNPLYQSTPASSGRVSPAPGVSLYYERRGAADAPEKVLLLMGAFGSLRHLDEFADVLAASHGGRRFEVLTVDHRGAGRSTPSPPDGSPQRRRPLVAQSAALLAADAAALLRALWPGAPRLHVYGVSMGGMVAQHLALLLLDAARDAAVASSSNAPPPRLASLTLATTARAYGWSRYVPLPPLLLRLALLPVVRVARARLLVAWLLPRCFPPEALAAVPHPEAQAGGSDTFGALWACRWTDEFSDWFALLDLDAVAEQASVATRHHLSDADAAALRASGVPILVKCASRDALIAPAAQRHLAAALGASLHETDTGHMGDAQDNAAFAARMARFCCDAP